MSFTPFKEVSTANPGTSTRYGSDDLLDIMRIFNAKITGNRRPDIINPWRFSGPLEFKQVTDPTSPVDSDVIILYNDSATNKLHVKKVGGTTVNIEDLGSGTWSNSAVETITNKTIPVESNFIKHGTTNFQGDLLTFQGTRYNRLSKGAANQVLSVNASGTDLEWQTPEGGGGGAGESNTASNVGTAGIGWFLQKLGVDLQFKKVFSPTGSILITDNPANERVDLEIGSDVVKADQINIFGDFQQEFRSSRLVIKNPANTFGYFLVGGAITASRNISFPVIAANDTFTLLNAAQIMQNKTLSTNNEIIVDQNTIRHSTTNNLGELFVNNGNKFDRRAKGAAGTFLKVNSSGTDLEWDLPETASSLNDLTDVEITLPVNGQALIHNGTNWVNQSSTGTTREDLAAVFGPCGVDDLDSGYTDAQNSYVTFAGSSLDTGTKAVCPIEFTGKTQYRVSIALVTGSGDSIDVRIVDDGSTGNVLHEFTNNESATLTSSLNALPGWATGLKTLRLQVGGGGGGDDVGVSVARVFLK